MAEQSTPQDAPSEKELTTHSYDGIQEYDNPTPLWWDLLFVGSVIFAPLYALWFHAPLQGRSLAAQYETALAENMRLQFGEIGELTGDEATLLKYLDDDKWLQVGVSVFKTNCVSCHGQDGSGISGPNLTDDYYLNVKEIADVAKVVKEGAKNGAMPAWGNRLHPNEVVLVSAYVASLRGQGLEGKYTGDKGKEIAPWPAAPEPDEDGAPVGEQAARPAAVRR